MKKALLKDCFKEIIKGFKRFISKLTLDTYFDEKNVMDIQVISTLGLTDEDITELEKLDEIENAEGTYQTDAIVTAGDKQFVVKLESMADTINNLQVMQGRLPENQNECVVEEGFILGTDYKIGDTIKIQVDNITDDDGNNIELLKSNELQIVGIVRSPMYISTDRGSTKLGSGVINYYLYVHPDNINTNIYTNIYLTVKGAKELRSYNDNYEELIEEAKNKIEEIADNRKEARYKALYDKANQKLQDAKNEFETQKSDGEKQLQEAENEINAAKQELENGKNELAANRNSANEKFQEAAKQLEDARNTLQESEQVFESKKEEAEKQIQEYETNLQKLKDIQTQYNNLKNTLENNQEEVKILNDELKTLDEVQDTQRIEEINTRLLELNQEIAKLQAGLIVINKQLEAQGITDIDQTVTYTENAIQSAKDELENGQKEIDSAKTELEMQENQLNETKHETYAQLNSAQNTLDASEKQIEEGEKELEKSREEFNSKIADAEKELDSAEEEVNSIERPTWYILDRQQNVGYVSYMQDTDRVNNLAQVFPIVFFLVAALISLTSMTRMVEEQRVQIGTLKAL